MSSTYVLPCSIHIKSISSFPTSLSFSSSIVRFVPAKKREELSPTGSNITNSLPVFTASHTPSGTSSKITKGTGNMSRYLHANGKTRGESNRRWRLTDPPEGRNRTTYLGDYPYGTPNWHSIEPPVTSRTTRSTEIDARAAASSRTPRSFEFDARAAARPDDVPGSYYGYPTIRPPTSNSSAPRNHRGDQATRTPSNTRRGPTVLESFQDSGPRVQAQFYGQGSNGQNSGQAICGRDHEYINDNEGYGNGSQDRRGRHHGGSQERDTRAETSLKQGKRHASGSTTSQSPRSHHSGRSSGHRGHANNEQSLYDRMLAMSLQQQEDKYAADGTGHRQGEQRTHRPSTIQPPSGHHRERSALRRLRAYDADRMLAMSLQREQNQDSSGMVMGEAFPDYMGDPRSQASGYEYGEQSASAILPTGRSERHRRHEGVSAPLPARNEGISLIAQELQGEGSKSILRNKAQCGVCLEDFPLSDLYRPCPGNRCPSYCADCTKGVSPSLRDAPFT